MLMPASHSYNRTHICRTSTVATCFLFHVTDTYAIHPGQGLARVRFVWHILQQLNLMKPHPSTPSRLSASSRNLIVPIPLCSPGTSSILLTPLYSMKMRSLLRRPSPTYRLPHVSSLAA